MYFRNAIVIFLVGLQFVTSLRGEIIAPDRRFDWSQNSGLQFQIPSWPNGRNAKLDSGAVGDGTHDDTAAIQDCLDKTPAQTLCYLPPGVYRITASLMIATNFGSSPSGSKGLRGAGPGHTKIMADSNVTQILTTDNYGFSNWIGVTPDGAIKDSTRIYLQKDHPDFPKYHVGDLVMIDQENGGETENIPDYMKRTLGQTNVVTSVGSDSTRNSDFIDVKTPLTHTFQGASISRCGSAHKNIGIEDLAIDRVLNSTGRGHNINLNRGINFWVRNVYSANAPNWHVNVGASYGTVVRDSWFEQTWQFNCGGNACYGVQLFGKTSDTFVENNIFKLLRHSMIIEYGGTDNIFGYNYSCDPINEGGLSTDYLMGDMISHGGHTHMNLWEGNIGAKIIVDNVLGSSRHNTFFRNNVEVKSIPSVYVGMTGIDDQIGNLYENFVGNILGSSGKMKNLYRLGTWQDKTTGTAYNNINLPDERVQATMLSHGNYNSLTSSTIWDPNIYDHSIQNSLYYSARPLWWPSSVIWPPHGPDVVNLMNAVPAKICYEKGKMPNCFANGTGSTPPTPTPSPKPDEFGTTTENEEKTVIHPLQGEKAVLIFYLSAKGLVTADLYGRYARYVTRLFEAEADIGNVTIVWDGKEKNGEPAASGVYMISIKTADGIIKRKVAVVN